MSAFPLTPIRAAGRIASLLALGGLAAAAPADEGTLLWQAAGIENVVCIASIADVGGQGCPDIVFESFDSNAPQSNHLFCIRGQSVGTGQVIWSARPQGGPGNSGGYGDYCLSVSPDVTGDGIEDVLLGTAWDGRSAHVLSGVDGDAWWTFDTSVDTPPDPPASGWVNAIRPVRDLTGDGAPEVVFCAGTGNDGLYLADGATGAILWFHRHTSSFLVCNAVGDVDGDGADDVAAGAGDAHPIVCCLSGPGAGGNPRVFWSLNYPSSVQTLEPLESIDGDPFPEIVTGCADGYVRCHDGATGGALWTGPALGVSVARVAVVGDLNGDGTDDLAVGLHDNKVVTLSGRTGALLWTQTVGTAGGGDTWAVDGAGDATGDDVPEVVVGSFDTKIYLMDGVDGEILWEYATTNRVLTVRGVPDLNSNGVPDVVGGTQKLGGTGGIAYAIEGFPPGNQSAPEAVAAARGGLSVWPSPRFGDEAIRWSANAPGPGRIKVQVIDADGRVVRTLDERGLAAGAVLRGAWDARDGAGRPMPAGVFWIRGELEGRPLGARRVTLLR